MRTVPSNMSRWALNTWKTLAPRERRLALLTAVAVALFLVTTVWRTAMNRLSELDARANALADTLLNYRQQIARRAAVESAYAKIAAQHSSQWSEAEIHDRLRQEIYRLARKVPQDLDETGKPLNVPNEMGNLVEIPSLGKGEMTEGGKGYRQYLLNLRIPQTNINDLVSFLERLQSSPQSLRIDRLEISRNPDNPVVSAVIDITRTVADGYTPPPELADFLKAGGGAGSAAAKASPRGRIPLNPEEWTVKQCAATREEDPNGRPYLRVRATGDGAVAELPRQLPAKTALEMIVEAAASGHVTLGVGDADGRTYPTPEPMRPDGTHRYTVRFMPSGNGERVACPRFTLENAGAAVSLYALLIRDVTE